MSDLEKQVSKIGVVVVQSTAVFDNNAEIAAVLADDGHIYGSLQHLCRALGLDQESQLKMIEEHGALPDGLVYFPLVNGIRVVTTPCLRSDLIALWLAVVPVQRLKAEKREKIVRYQQRVADVLNRLFGPPETVSETTAVVPVEPDYAEGLAIARLSLETAELAQLKVEEVDGRVTAMEARLLALEARLMPREPVAEEQAERIVDLVKQAAVAMSAKMGGGNFFGQIYGHLYRRFGITSYKLLTQAQYPQAVSWLEKLIRENS